MGGFVVPALILIIGSLLVPLLRGTVRKIYIMALPALSLINLLMMKPGAELKIGFITGFKLTLIKADWLSLTVGFAFVIIGFFALLYTIQVKETAHQMLALWYLGGALGIIFAGDFLTLYIFWELIAVVATGFVLLEKQEETRQAAFRYLIMHIIGGLLLLGGIWLQYLQTSSIAITHFETTSLPFWLILAGVGVNAGFVFVHTWIPDTYPKASYTASIFLSVLTTKAAAYVLARVAPGWEFVAYMGAAMAVFGASMALMQNNARKLFSYSIISQVGFMVAAIGIGSHGVEAGVFHLFNNVLFKSLLFMTIGAVIYSTGKENLSELGGLAKKMPVTAAAATIAALSMAGVPSLNGFVSKSLIFEAAHSYDAIYLLLELAAIGTLFYSLKFIYFAFLRPNPQLETSAKDVPLNMNIAMGSVAAICLAIGIFPSIATSLFPEHLESMYTGANLIGILQILIIGGGAFAIWRESIFKPVNRVTYDLDVIYIKVIENLVFIPRLLSDFNNWLEAKSESIPYYLSLTKKPVSSFTNYLSDTLFVLWVDFWLFKPAGKLGTQTPSETEELSPLENKLLFRPFYWIMKFLDSVSNRMSKAASFFDTNIVDKTAEGMATVMFSQKEVFQGHKVSSLANLFDKIVVDGIVNGVARIVFFFGETARRMQTGLVQSYALIIVFAIAFAIFALSIKGGFK